MYARRDFLKKAASLTGASVFPLYAAPMVACAEVQSSPTIALSRLHPYMPMYGDSNDYFVAVDSYRESVDAVINYSNEESPDRALVILDNLNLNGMGSTSLMLVSRTLRLHKGTILYSGSNFYIVTQQSDEVIDKFKRYLHRADSLYIDDVQFLRGKSEAQHLLLKVANNLLKQGQRVVFTIDEVTGDREGWSDGFHEFLRTSEIVRLPYPSTFDIEEILRFHMLRSPRIPSDQDVRDAMPSLVTRNVQQYSADLPNIRMFKGALLRVLNRSKVWDTNTDIEQQLEHELKDWLA